MSHAVFEGQVKSDSLSIEAGAIGAGRFRKRGRIAAE